jgi:hypothetical protein
MIMGGEPPNPKILRIDVTGYKHASWRETARTKFIRTLRYCLKKLGDAPINPETKETVSEEGSKLTAKGLQALESQLDKQPIENQLKQAQIEKLYEEKEKVRVEKDKTEAETRKVTAEAIALELQNFEKWLALKARLEKKGKKLSVEIGGAPGDEAIFFGSAAKILAAKIEASEKQGDKLSG